MSFEAIIITLLLAILAAQLWQLRSRRGENSAMQQAIRREVHGLFNQFEAYQYLRDRLHLHDGLPYTTDWSAAPDFLKLIVEHALQHKPRTIVECSSGLTSVMLARCCEMNGQGHIYSLENGAEFAAKSRDNLGRYGLEGHATVLDAPLRPYTLGDSVYQWYALDALPDHSIEMLVIDGPPGFIQRHSRYPALPLLRDKLASGCTIFLDDAARPDEREIVSLWQRELPGLQHRYIKSERGTSVLVLEE